MLELENWLVLRCSGLYYCICYSVNVEIVATAVVGWQVGLESLAGNLVKIV